MMHAAVNVMGALVAGLCAVLLLRAYRRVRMRLLLWSGLCFVGLSVSNALVFYDLALVPHLNLYSWRLGIAAFATLLLVYGLVFESD